MNIKDLKENRELIIERLDKNNRVLKSGMEKIAKSIDSYKDVEPTEENIINMVDTLCPNPIKKASKKAIKKAKKREKRREMIAAMPEMTSVELQEADEERRAKIMKKFNQEN